MNRDDSKYVTNADNDVKILAETATTTKTADENIHKSIIKHSNKNRILFSSCHSQYYDTVLWDSMSFRNATAFVWGGDSIYGDTFHRNNRTMIETLLFKRFVQQAEPQDLIDAYNQLLQDPGYNQFMTKKHATKKFRHHFSNDNDNNDENRTSTSASIPSTTGFDDDTTVSFDRNVTILGTFDDHDYGIDNGDKLYKYKRESAIAYMDFLKQSNVNTIDLSIMDQRANSGKGVYGVKVRLAFFVFLE